MTGDVHSSTFEKVTDICANQVAPFLSRSRVFEKIIAKSVKNEKQALVIEIFRVLANCSAQLPQSSLKLVCEASLRNKRFRRKMSYINGENPDEKQLQLAVNNYP